MTDVLAYVVLGIAALAVAALVIGIYVEMWRDEGTAWLAAVLTLVAFVLLVIWAGTHVGLWHAKAFE